MTSTPRPFALTAFAIAQTMLLAACGGGAEPPPDLTAPTVAITDNVAGASTDGPVIFTFTFSEDVGSSFTAEDIVVTGGTAGTLAKFSDTQYTLTVTPTADAAGTISVSLAANKFTDTSGNANTGTAAGSQAYDTRVAPPPPPPPPPPSGALISWDEPDGSSPVSGIGAYGDAAPTVETAPTGGSAKALKITRSGAQNFGGTYFTVTPALPFTSTNKTITARVYASRAGAVINLKVEVPGGAFVELPATVTAANTWQTLTWNFTAVNPASSYTVIAISPDTDVAIGGAQSYWIDDITVTATSGGGGGGGASGSTGTCTAPCIDFASAGVGYEPFEGLVSAAQDNDPVDAANKVAKFVKGPTGQPWAGATIFTDAGNKSVTALDLATNKVVTLRVYAPAVGQKITLKVENAANAGVNILKTVLTTQANAWHTLSFDFAAPTQGAFNGAETYNKVSVFPLFDPTEVGPVAPASDTTFYFDELKYTGVGGGGGGGGALTFSTGFAASGLTVQGGAFGGFGGSNLDGYGCSGDPAWCGGGGDISPAVAAADSYFYYYYQTPSIPADVFVGIYLMAPGVTGLSNTADTAGVQINGQASMKFKVGQNAEWFGTATNKFAVNLELGKRYVVGGNTCRVQLRRIVTPTAAAATDYTVALSSFYVVQDCAQPGITVASALAGSPISQVSFQGAGGGIPLTTPDGQSTGANRSVQVNGVYPSTVVVVGGISFE